MRFRITIDGATEEQIKRGGQAALQILQAEGITPWRFAAAQRVADNQLENIFTTEEVADETEKVLAGAARADAAAVQACCAGWAAADIPETARLEVFMEEVTDEERFEAELADLLEDICMERYFHDGRPEDEVAFLLDDSSPSRLTDAHRALYESRILPLLRIRYFYPDRFQSEYHRLRAEWAKEDEATNVQPLQPH